MDHSPSLARQPAVKQSHHNRRRSLSQSIAAWSSNSSRRMSAWMESISHPKGVQNHNPPSSPPPNSLPARPGTGEASHSHTRPRPRFRIAHLSISTPSLLSTAFQHLPPSPPPSPPETFSSMKPVFHQPGYVTTTTNPGVYTPPDSQSSSTTDLRRIHSRTRSLSTALGDSISLIGKRGRRHTASSPSPPPHPPSPSPPPPPPLPPPQFSQKRPRAAPVVIQNFEAAFLRELTFSPSPLMEVARTPQRTLPSSRSPTKADKKKNKHRAYSIMMLPSENESREFTKANTLQVQKRLEEVEAARMRAMRSQDVDSSLGSGRTSYSSLDLILSGYVSSDESTRRLRRANRPLGAGGQQNPLAMAGHQDVPIKQPKRQSPITKPLAAERKESRNSLVSLAADLKVSGNPVTLPWSLKPLDIEAAFSSLGGFGSGGIWRKIGVLLEPWDLARLARVSTRMKRVIEPLLYESISLCPNYPHGFSYSYLCHLFTSLHSQANRSKLQKWTKAFRLEKGWELNQICLMDHDSLLMDDEIIDPKTGDTIIDKEQMKVLRKEEGLIGDGGTTEVNAYISDLLQRMPKLKSFTWDSPIPLRGHLLATMSTMHITHLALNLSQPVRKRRPTDDSRELADLPKYRPQISTLATLPLVELRLHNLPTRGGEWWHQLWDLAAASIDTLRVLTLEMPAITPERYRGLFGHDYRIYHIPKYDDDARHLKTPPVFDWNAFTAAKKVLGRSSRQLRLHTLELTGFVVDEKILNDIAPGCLKSLSLLGCIEKAGFRFSKDCWRGISSFRCTGLGFAEHVIDALDTWALPPKSIAFLTEEDETTSRESLDALRAFVLGAFPRCGARVDRIVMKEQWQLTASELQRLFSASEHLTEVSLAVENSPDAWNVFLHGIAKCKMLRKVHVLNGFSRCPGGVRRYVVDDAHLVFDALVAAWERGGLADLQGMVVTVRRVAWSIARREKGWEMVRVRGLINEVGW